jgi:hypothetical protein
MVCHLTAFNPKYQASARVVILSILPVRIMVSGFSELIRISRRLQVISVNGEGCLKQPAFKENSMKQPFFFEKEQISIHLHRFWQWY